MSDSVLDMARKKKETADQALQDSARRLEQVKRDHELAAKEASGWADFVERMHSLTNGKIALPQAKKTPAATTGKHVEVQRDSTAGLAAALIKEKGPMTLGSIVKHFVATGRGQDNKKFRNCVNSALWRRQNDLFEKTDEGYKLRDSEFVWA